MNKLTIIDYGCGNIHSIKKASEKASIGLDFEVCVSNQACDIDDASHIILPGVGAFGDCMAGILQQNNLIAALQDNVIEKRKNFLGICVGMQLLANFGFERGEHKGLGWIKGQVTKIPFKENYKIPHMGWNNINIDKKHPLFKDIANNEDFYFVHSYHFECENSENIIASVDYSAKLVAAIALNNIYGVQFHPEKSQDAGIKIIANFLGFK